jgi:hypothetical protein
VLGAIFFALTLSGSAWGQSLGVVGSALETTTESVQPVTQTVTSVVTKATKPAVQPVAKAQPAEPAQPAQSAASTPAPASSPGDEVGRAGDPAGRHHRPDGDGRATRSVEPLATRATRTVTRTLAALPSETQALLSPLVETIDGQAEELTGSLLGSTTTALGGTIGALTGVSSSSQGPWQGPPTALGGGTGGDLPPASGSTEAVLGASADRHASNGPPPAGSAAFAAPPYPAGAPAAPATTSQGGRGADGSRSSEAPPMRSQPAVPTAPGSALGSSSGFSPAFAVLAGLFALALAAFLGRLLPWSDTLRPLAFVLPPERPG